MVEAANGADAVVVSDHFDLLVSDVVMPGMSGREVAHTLLATRPKLRILYMSGYTGEVLERFGDLEWNEDFIAKPFRPDELAAKVREVLNRDEPLAKERA